MKKRNKRNRPLCSILGLVLGLLLCASASAAGDKTLQAGCPFRSGETVLSYTKKDGITLSLPGSWDPTAVTLEIPGSDKVMIGKEKREIAAIRKKTAFVFQNYNLFLNKNVLQNVTLGLTAGAGMKRQEAERIARDALERVGMADKLKSYPSQLSGGQQQRVAIAWALATDPEIIYFDEPTSALDPELIGEVLAVMRQLAEDGMTMLVVTHEMDFARSVSNKVVFMENGKIIEEGPSKDFFENPKENRSREFIRTILEGRK